MLQQTQVATVIPYYRRFLRAFPTLERLARAPLERVLQLWSGLGYYRRARHLQLASQAVIQKFGGSFPRDYHEARSLAGVGDYTARAILSIAFNLPYTVMDGNVARVVARLRAFKGHLHQPHFHRSIARELERLISRRQPGNFNQALMELGQTVCLPRAPRCPRCPIRRWCKAHQRSSPELYPAPRPRRASEPRSLATAVIQRDKLVLMVRGLDDGLLGDLWNFPAAFGKSPSEARARLRARLGDLVGGSVRIGKQFGEMRHGITYRSIHVQIYQAGIDAGPQGRSVRWIPISRVGQAAVSQLARKIAAIL
jgi:A/G-specific adenine glycosylase